MRRIRGTSVGRKSKKMSLFEPVVGNILGSTCARIELLKQLPIRIRLNSLALARNPNSKAICKEVMHLRRIS